MSLRDVALAWLAVCLFACCRASAVAAVPMTADRARALVVTQVVEPDGATRLSARLVIVAALATGLGAGQLEQPVDGSGIVPLPVHALPTGTAAGAALKVASRAIGAVGPGVLRSIAAVMATEGVATGWFTFSQSWLSPAGMRHLTWSAYVDHQGRMAYGDPDVVDDVPLVLYAQYVPVASRRGLPENWRYPGAGRLTWQLRDLTLQANGPVHWVDTAGAFDEPQGGKTDPDARLKCLADRRSSADCPAGAPDLRTLIDREHAAFAMLDYVRMIRPVYLPATNGHSVAAAAVDIYRRRLRFADCARGYGLFENAYRIGYRLALQSDRIAVNRDGAWTLLGRAAAEAVSPVDDRQRVALLPPGLAPRLGHLVVHPDTGKVVDIATFPPGQLVSVAAVEYECMDPQSFPGR